MVRDLLIGGFDLIEWPVEFGVFGIKAFIAHQLGVRLREGFGPRCGETQAQAIKTFNPDSTWEVG